MLGPKGIQPQLMLPALIIFIFLQHPFFNLLFHDHIDDMHDHRHCRYSEKHSKYTKIRAAHCNTKDNPKRFDPCEIAKDLWSKIQTIKLLQNQYHDHINYSIFWFDHKINDNSWYSTNKWAKIWNHISNPYDHTEKQTVRKLDHGHNDQ